MQELRVGINLPYEREKGVEGLRAVLGRVAEVGLDHVGFGDHVSFHGGGGNDGLIAATAVLVLHPSLEAYVGVYLLPLRHPVLVARQLATLASFAPGRLILGLGVGGEDRHEVEICGVDPRTRGRRMDEAMAALRQLLSGEPVTFRGEFFDFEAATILPPPPEPIPLIVGGRSDAAVRRAGRLGDGWLGIWNSPRRFAAAVEIVDEEAAAAGRQGVRWQHGMQVWCGLGASGDEARGRVAAAMERVYRLPFGSFERYVPAGRAQDVAEFLKPYREVGCSSFNLIAYAESVEAAIEGAAEIKRLLRSE